MITINELLKLTPQKLTIAILLIAVSFLWFKLETTEGNGDGKVIKSEGRYDKLQNRFDSLQNIRLTELQDCADAALQKELETVDFLRRILSEKEELKKDVIKSKQRVENMDNKVQKLKPFKIN